MSECNIDNDYFTERLNFADDGDMDAQLEIGLIYCIGEDLDVDYAKSYKYLTMAAEQGSLPALHMTGVLYHNGYGVEQDYRKSIDIFKKAANLGCIDSQFTLGRCYLNGEGVANDDVEAYRWYSKAAEQNCEDAECMVALCCLDGIGIEKDEDKAVSILTKLSENGHADSQYELSQCLKSGRGVNQDNVQAVKWLRKSAKQNQAEAQFSMACYYKHGEGVRKDEKQAIKWLQLSAEQGYSYALHNLGLCYQRGEHFDKDDVKAAELFRQAADKGNYDAVFDLSMCYFHGDGVPKDMKVVMELLDVIISNDSRTDSEAYKQAKFVIDSNNELYQAMKEGTKMNRNEVFISYKRDEDDDILQELKTSLDVLKRNHDEIIYWYDGLIDTGQKWFDEIKLHLQKSRVAILLVSEAFLASDFIYNEELPELLQAAENENATIIWIPVSDSQVSSTIIRNKDKGVEVCISDYQAACDPKKPLRSMSPNERKNVYRAICNDLKKAYGIK